jgi:hypothetical protein
MQDTGGREDSILEHVRSSNSLTPASRILYPFLHA